jgi:hypothetical protein
VQRSRTRPPCILLGVSFFIIFILFCFIIIISFFVKKNRDRGSGHGQRVAACVQATGDQPSAQGMGKPRLVISWMTTTRLSGLFPPYPYPVYRVQLQDMR